MHSNGLRRLVQAGFLKQAGSSRGAVYHLFGVQIPGPEDVLDSPNVEASSPNLEGGSSNLASSSPHLERDGYGRLLSDRHTLSFVDKLEMLSPEYLKSSCVEKLQFPLLIPNYFEQIPSLFPLYCT